MAQSSIWGEIKQQDWYKAMTGIVVGIDAASSIGQAPQNQQEMLYAVEQPQGNPNAQTIDPKRLNVGMDSNTKLIFYGALAVAALGLVVVVAKS